MANYLEQLVSEWYEYQGYFVRKNVLVGKRAKGGYECELDVVAFHPEKKLLVHIEPSMDADSWTKREERYKKKFNAGKKYIPKLFKGITLPSNIHHIALFGYMGRNHKDKLAGGVVVTVSELIKEIVSDLKNNKTASNIIPEQYTILRTIMFISEHKNFIYNLDDNF